MARNLDADGRFAQLGIYLPNACQPAGNYRPALLVGNLLFVSGHTPDDARPEAYTAEKGCGKVGAEVSLDQGYQAARDTGLAILATVKAALGRLSRVKRLVSATGLVNCGPEFGAHPKVMNGFSDLMAHVFGAENGVGTRSATGANSLPGNVPVEVTQCIFEVHGQ